MYSILQFGAFILFFLMAIFSLGIMVCLFTKETISFAKLSIYGFATLLVCFQLIYSCFFYFKFSPRMLTYTFLAFSIIIFSIGLYLFVSKKLYYTVKLSIPSRDRVNWRLVAIVFLVTIKILLTFFSQHRDDDDAFYITIATSFSKLNAFGERNTLMGVPDSTYFSQYMPAIGQGWETLFGVCGEIFSVHPTILMHLIIPPIFIIFHYLAVYLIGTQLFSDNKKIQLFVLFMIIYNFFGFFLPYSQSSFLFFRLWQGKAVLANIMIPAMFYLYLKIWRDAPNIFREKDLLLFFLFSYGGRCLSIIEVYFILFSIFAFVIIFSIRAKNIVPIFQSVLSISLNLVAAIFVFTDMTSKYFETSVSKYLDVFRSYSGTSAVFRLSKALIN